MLGVCAKSWEYASDNARLLIEIFNFTSSAISNLHYLILCCLLNVAGLVHVVGFAPGPVAAADGGDGGIDLQWNYGLEPKKKKLKEQDFLENNSQISSVDFLQPRSVSTGLGLSLDNTRMASTGDSALLSLIGDDIDRELQQQDTEIDRFLRVQVRFYMNVSLSCGMQMNF